MPDLFTALEGRDSPGNFARPKPDRVVGRRALRPPRRLAEPVRPALAGRRDLDKSSPWRILELHSAQRTQRALLF